MDADKAYLEIARWELHKNDTSHTELILETTFHKIAAVRQLTTHLEDDPNKTNNTRGTLLKN